MSLAQDLIDAALAEGGPRKSWLSRLPQGVQKELEEAKRIYLQTRGKTAMTATSLARQIVAFAEKEGHDMPGVKEVQRWLTNAT